VGVSLIVEQIEVKWSAGSRGDQHGYLVDGREGMEGNMDIYIYLTNIKSFLLNFTLSNKKT
jgi:hypothetical protein